MLAGWRPLGQTAGSFRLGGGCHPGRDWSVPDEPAGVEKHAQGDCNGSGEGDDSEGAHGVNPLRIYRAMRWSAVPSIAQSSRNALQNGPCGALMS